MRRRWRRGESGRGSKRQIETLGAVSRGGGSDEELPHRAPCDEGFSRAAVLETASPVSDGRLRR
ncbi:hypothetical protein D8S78_03535 [Natrialba swarupiae]|nr:hypothetical protein [Natrialba swarupiae]